jgi:hypothetical protein
MIMRCGNGGVDSGASDYHYFRDFQGGDGGSDEFNHNAAEVDLGVGPGGTSDSDAFAHVELRFMNYTSTTERHTFMGHLGGVYSATRYRNYVCVGSHKSGATIDRVDFYPEAGTDFVAGSLMRCYGVGGFPLV